jgi:hypothetical protein
MRPSELRAESFSRYPHQAEALAVQNLPLLRRIPLALLPLFLRQLINYDWLFPPEQRDLVGQFNYLAGLPESQFDALMAPYAAMRLPQEISDSDWVNEPKHFAEQLSAYLWSVHQIDAYHQAVRDYQQQLEAELAKEVPETSRYTMVILGAGVKETNLTLFRRLQPHGTLFTNVDQKSGVQTLLSALNARARKYPGDYAHWYIDGGEPEAIPGPPSGISLISYGSLAPAVRRELTLLNRFRTLPPKSGETGVEAATSYMADMKAQDLGLGDNAGSQVLQHFALDMLTEGAGTQVYSTTFVQWTARECLHRAQPLTLVVRFRPRQEAAPMNQLLSRDPFAQATDAEGSLVDADMGAYLTWINQNRLPGADQSRFLAWFEDHGTAIAIGPSMARGTTSNAPADLAKILDWMA